MLKRRLVGDTYLLAPAQRLRGEQEYQIEAHLAGGAFSAGYLARAEDGSQCFIKEYLPALRPGERAELEHIFRQECDVLRRIGSYELCPRFWDAFESCGFRYLVQDFIPGRDLESLLEARTEFNEETLVRWSLSLCHALAFLHSRNVVHHDLKPSNVRLNADGDPAIVDFGAARWYRSADEKSDVLYGTEGYLAPEHAGRGAEDLAAGMRMDIFALGRILVEMMVGQRLTQADIDQRHDQLYGSILHSKTLDIGFVRAIFKSVSYNPDLRYPSALEMEKDLVAAAPPIGRRRPAEIDLGTARDTRPREATISIYNAGGGTLTGEVSTDVDWLQVGVEGVSTAQSQPFSRNRQTVRVVAYPERLAAGISAAASVVISCPPANLTTIVRLRRALDASQVVAQPDRVRMPMRPQGGRASITIRNRSEVPVRVRIEPPAAPAMALEPSAFELGPGRQQAVSLRVDGAPLPDHAGLAALAWFVDGEERPPIPVEFESGSAAGLGSVIRGLRRSSGKQ
jgi:serine/threonine protein kinase